MSSRRLQLSSGLAMVAAAVGCATAPAASAAGYDPTGPYPALEARVTGPQQSGLVFDAEGVPKVRYRFGTFYNPAVVARQGLAIANAYMTTTRFHTERDLRRVQAIARWLVTNQDRRGRWLYRFNITLPAVGTRVNAPWASAMAQGLAMSFLTRAHRLTGDPAYLAAAQRALAPFASNTRRGGVVADFGGRPWYEEYPSVRPTHVLNGFMFALIGLYDECRWAARACSLFNVGLSSLRLRINRFERPGGSFYYPGAVPARSAYHRLHVALLSTLMNIRRVPALDKVRRRWAARL